MVTKLHHVQMCLVKDSLSEMCLQNKIPDQPDLGFVVREFLIRVFGKDHAPRPFFALPSEGESLDLVGYSTVPAAVLQVVAEDQDAPFSFDLETIVTTPVAAQASGALLDYEVRVCPTRRSSQTKNERDAFFFSSNSWVSREEAYKKWLIEKFETCARVETCHLEGWQITKLYRGRGRSMTLPEAEFRGILRVLDPAAFLDLLGRGAGRHAAYGFGMIRIHQG